MKTELFYADSALLCPFKPAGLPSQGDRAGAPSLLSALQEEYGAVYPVHRLDRDTAGVMVYARTSAAAAALSASLQEGKFDKEYLAVATGRIPSPEGDMRDMLLHDAAKNLSRVVSPEKSGAKAACLSYRLLSEAGGFSLFRIHLETGRTHQIRVQFASRGLPLAGDRKYGGVIAPSLALFCALLSFPHPETGKILSFRALPDFNAAPWSFFKDILA